MSVPTTEPTPVDAIVIGAGPVGLWQVFQLGLQGITHVPLIDALPHLGGQCAELYHDKPIYDIPGIAHCTGLELVQRLVQQIAPFAPECHLTQQVAQVAVQSDGRVLLGTTTGRQWLARTVFIAAGVGAFVPRPVKADGIEAFVGTQLRYHPAAESLASTGAGRHVVVHGGDEAAVHAALQLADPAPGGVAAASVTLLHRRDAFQADAPALERLQALRRAGRIRVVIGQITGIQAAEGTLQALTLVNAEGAAQRLPLDLLLAYLGISPRLGPIADWGLALERKHLLVDTASFATSVPGIYAVGDINTYPGKRKLILCGFHEATLAAFGAAEYLAGAPVTLQYTTSSTRLQTLLGVAPPPPSV